MLLVFSFAFRVYTARAKTDYPMQPSNPLFSIIIPCYNPGAKLRTTIESVLAQGSEGFAFEVIAMDGGSSDAESLAALSEYSSRAEVTVVSEPDTGVYDAMNKGIGLSRGEYLNVQGAGDLLLPGALAMVAGALGSSLAPDVAYGNVYLKESGRTAGGVFEVSDFRRKRNVYHQAMFFRRSVFDAFGLYDLRYPIRADNVLNMRLWADEKVVKLYLDETLAKFEEGGLSDTRVDTAFERDFGGLVRELYGWREYAIYCLASVKYRFAARRNLSGLSGHLS